MLQKHQHEKKGETKKLKSVEHIKKQNENLIKVKATFKIIF